MNGRISARIVLDTNTAIEFIDKTIAALPDGERFVSIITEMELFASPLLTTDDEQDIRNFLSFVTIVPLTDRIKEEAIRIRRYGNPRLKLPDAIIAATAVVLNATLVTGDIKMLNLDWSELRFVNVR